MKAVAILPLLVLTLIPSQESIDFKPKVGQKVTYQTRTEISLGGQEALVLADLEVETKKADEKSTEVVGKWSEIKVTAGDAELPVEVNESTIELSPTRHPLKVRGGINGSDAVQMFVMTHFIPPTEKDLTPGMKYGFDIAEVKDEIPAYRYDGEYVGKETVDGKDLHKFTATVKMKGTDALESKQVVWIRHDGVMTKVEATFKNMDVPIANMKSDGKATLTLKS